MRLIVDRSSELKFFLVSKLNISKNKAKKLIDSRQIFVNQKRVWIASYNIKKGDIIEINDDLLNDNKNQSLEIIYEDDYFIAINKPAGLLSNGAKNSAENIIRSQFNDSEIVVSHRLDYDTSGALLFAKNKFIFEDLKKLWKDHSIKKIYYVISKNKADFKSRIIDSKIEGKTAFTEIETIDTNLNYTLFRIRLKSGRKHQIRIHLASIGYPVVGDKIYGYKEINDKDEIKLSYHLLHAESLYFKYKNKDIYIKAEFPDYFMTFMKTKGLNLKFD